jgi:hypothetical protein
MIYYILNKKIKLFRVKSVFSLALKPPEEGHILVNSLIFLFWILKDFNDKIIHIVEKLPLSSGGIKL